MASNSCFCVACYKDMVRGSSVSSCGACAIAYGIESNFGELCGACHDLHIQGRGRYASHAVEKIVSERDILLGQMNLLPTRIMCEVHPGKPVELKCRCDDAMCCHSCTFSMVHSGHSMDLVEEAAPIARQLILGAAFTPTSRISLSSSSTASSEQTEDAPAVIVARTAALRVEEELAALPLNASKALSLCEAACDSVISSVVAFRTRFSADLRTLVAVKTVTLCTELTLSDERLRKMREAVSGALQAVKVLGDLDTVAHADAIVGFVSASRRVIEESRALPVTSAAIVVCTDDLSAVLNAVSRMVVIAEDGCTLPPIAASSQTDQRGVAASAVAAARALASTFSVLLPPHVPQRTLAAATAAQRTPIVVSRFIPLSEQLDAVKAAVDGMAARQVLQSISFGSPPPTPQNPLSPQNAGRGLNTMLAPPQQQLPGFPFATTDALTALLVQLLSFLQQQQPLTVSPFADATNTFSASLVQFLSILRRHQQCASSVHQPISDSQCALSPTCFQQQPFKPSISRLVAAVPQERVSDSFRFGMDRGLSALSSGGSSIWLPQVITATLQASAQEQRQQQPASATSASPAPLYFHPGSSAGLSAPGRAQHAVGRLAQPTHRQQHQVHGTTRLGSTDMLLNAGVPAVFASVSHAAVAHEEEPAPPENEVGV